MFAQHLGSDARILYKWIVQILFKLEGNQATFDESHMTQ